MRMKEWEWRSENETYVYLTKYNLGIWIKCVGLTQFGNKECESHSYGGGLGIKMWEWEWNINLLFYTYNFFIFSKLPLFKSQIILLF